MKKFKVKFKKFYLGRYFATCIGILEGDILKITEEVWSIVKTNEKVF